MNENTKKIRKIVDQGLTSVLRNAGGFGCGVYFNRWNLRAVRSRNRVILRVRCAKRRAVRSIRLRNGQRRSCWSTCLLCRPKKQKLCAKKFASWLLRLPAAQVAEKLHDLGKARVFILYPELPQNLHKLPLVVIPQNLFQLTQQRGLFFERESAFLGHTRANSNRLLRPLLAVDVHTQLDIQEAA